MKMEKNDITNKVLNFDVVSDFEQQLGKRHEDWTESEQLQFLRQAVISNQVNQGYFKNMGDTHFGISWNEFLLLCENQGFEIAYRQDFLDDQWEQKKIEEEIILFHREKGFILYADSYSSKTSVNSAKLYGEIRKKEDIDEREAFQGLFRYSHFRTQYGTQEISLDVREGMVKKLSQLDGKYEFVTPWNKMPFVWFLNYMEEKALRKDAFGRKFEKINQQKIALMSADAQKIMGYSSAKKL